MNVKLWVSFLEVYNDKVYDLLNPKNLTNMEIREAKNGTIQIPEMTYANVNTIQDALKYLVLGLKVPHPSFSL